MILSLNNLWCLHAYLFLYRRACWRTDRAYCCPHYITFWFVAFRFIVDFIILPTFIFGTYMHIYFYIGGQVGGQIEPIVAPTTSPSVKPITVPSPSVVTHSSLPTITIWFVTFRFIANSIMSLFAYNVRFHIINCQV